MEKACQWIRINYSYVVRGGNFYASLSLKLTSPYQVIFFVILILIFDRDQRIRCLGRFPCWAKNVSWKKENEPEKKRRRERWTGIISRNEYITKPTALIINQQFILANWAQSPLGSEVSIEAGVQRSAAAYRGSSTPTRLLSPSVEPASRLSCFGFRLTALFPSTASY